MNPICAAPPPVKFAAPDATASAVRTGFAGIYAADGPHPAPATHSDDTSKLGGDSETISSRYIMSRLACQRDQLAITIRLKCFSGNTRLGGVIASAVFFHPADDLHLTLAAGKDDIAEVSGRPLPAVSDAHQPPLF